MIMRILHLCLGNFFIDNYSYQENMLTKYHVLQGHDVAVIASLFTFDENGKGKELPSPNRYKDKNGFEVIRLAYKRPKKWNRFFRHYNGLESAIEEFCPDVIFSHNVSYGDTKLVRDYLVRHPEVRLFADNHADYVNSAKNWLSYHVKHRIIWRFYAKKLEPYMVRCYGVTPMRCRFLKEMYHIAPNKIEFLPMGVDDNAIPENREEVRNMVRRELGIDKHDTVIFTGGKIDRLKNTHVLISALEKMKNDHVHLVICGTLTPSMEHLRESIDANNHIHYLGWCDASRVMNCMVASDLACFPGTHSTLWEQAVGVGLPSVFKKWNEMEHVNVNGNCVFINGDNVGELADSLTNMIIPTNFDILKKKAKEAARSFLYSEIARKAIDLGEDNG